ncbi:hypothetical protein [Planctomycetes bacterium K23_9]|uniref:DUF1207 domain-containing protein n=1 Tax=Stieleria marina TaxID=1930275 RepID=A0A517NNJ5_9BACT|nr:hypothetical protein K239x_06370 [Planctomycetes bacterium K23_9]
MPKEEVDDSVAIRWLVLHSFTGLIVERFVAGTQGAPFTAINLNFREAVDWSVSTTIQAGWSFQSPQSGRRIRFGAQYGDGPTSQYSFFQRHEQYVGGDIWFDY